MCELRQFQRGNVTISLESVTSEESTPNMHGFLIRESVFQSDCSQTITKLRVEMEASFMSIMQILPYPVEKSID